MQNILDNLEEIKKIDSQNMLGSLELLGKQVAQIDGHAKEVKMPKAYGAVKNIVILGMGGSALGADIIKSVFNDELKVPLEAARDYHLPGYVDANSFVVVSSYSGTTEECLAGLSEAKKKKAKLAIICSGGVLAQEAKKNKIPALVFSTENNPCGSPRMGLGYSIVGLLVVLHKAGLVDLKNSDIKMMKDVVDKYQKKFSASSPGSSNLAKQFAEKTQRKSVWFVASEHLAGNAHVAANQTNENTKRFGGYFLIPELNHHLMEGMMNPESNKDNLLFVFFESLLYDKRVQKRYEVSKEVLNKNSVQWVSYVCEEKDRLSQACELLVFSGYLSFYSAMLAGIDPTAIPFVDYFKEQLKK
ncbi:SIS domain-containing protein [Patescibacteria group bacterium]|nr:MAG: SIS domain-containing protein [Patescibacteria group bacterium]